MNFNFNPVFQIGIVIVYLLYLNINGRNTLKCDLSSK